MTFYSEQLVTIRDKFYPKAYLCEQVIQAKLFIDANFARTIGLDEIAGEAFFSKFHFIRIFKILYGRTPHQYLVSVRIRQAKQLLQKGLPVTEVCVAVGFSSISSFTRLFKKSTGSRPSSFRKKNGE